MPRSLCTIGALLCLSSAAAAAPVVARVDQTTISLNMRFVITVEIDGEDLGEPVIPNVNGLIIDKRPSVTSEGVSLSTGTRVRHNRLRGYGAVATKAGRIEIPPIGVRVDGQMHYSKPIVLTVAKDSPVTPRVPSQRELTWEDIVFIKTEVDKTEVFQGEPVLLTLSVWTLDDGRVGRSDLRGDLRYEPTTEGFYQSEVRTNESHDVVNDLPYRVVNYQRTLYPTATGTLTIGPWRWEGIAQFGRSIFDRQRREFRLDAAELEVEARPLPAPPANFSGAVGRFRLSAEVSGRETLQGVPMKLIVQISGQGNPDAIGGPLLDEIENAHLSQPDREVETDGFEVAKRFTYTITPLDKGTLTIPEVGFCYFDPEQEKYVTETEGAFTVQVLAAQEQGSVVFLPGTPDGKEPTVNVLGIGILPPITDPGRLRPSRPSPLTAPAVLAAPVLGYAALAAFLRRKRRFDNDTVFARAYRARPKCRKRLRAVAGSEDAPDALYRAVVGFMADKLGIEEAGLTSHDAQRALAERRAEPGLAATFLRVLRACERARYGGTPLSEDEVHALTHAALTNLDSLDAVLGEERNA